MARTILVSLAAAVSVLVAAVVLEAARPGTLIALAARAPRRLS